MLSRRLLSVSLLLLPACLDLRAQGLPIKTYATVDGLAHNHINRIVKDSRGFLWFCTAGGLSRFDGYAFANFGTEQGLPHSSVNDLLETRAGEYWVATDGGLVRFDPKGTASRRVVYENAADAPTPMFTVIIPAGEDGQASVITVLREGRDGTIWAGTNKGLFRLESANGRRSLRPVDVGLPNEFPEQRIIADVLEDARGSLWIAAPSGLYRRWPDGSAARYTARDGLPERLRSGPARGSQGAFMGRDTSQRLLPLQRRCHSPRRQWSISRSRTRPIRFAEHWVFQLFETSDRRFWVATARGLVEFFPDANEQGRFSFLHRTERLELITTSPRSTKTSAAICGWARCAGAMKLTRGGFITYGEQDGIETLNAIFEDRAGHLCFKGNVLGDARTSVFEGAKLDLLRGDQASIHVRLGCFDGRRFDWFKPAAVTRPGLGPGAGHAAGSKRRVVGGHGGRALPLSLSRQPRAAQDGATARCLHDDRRAGRSQVFRLFEDSRGNIWVSTVGSSRTVLPVGNRSTRRLHDLAGAPGLPSLKDDLPRSFGEDRSGNVWIGFNSGLARYAQDTFTLFTAREGLPPGTILNIHVDTRVASGSHPAGRDSSASTTPARSDPRSSATRPRKGCRATTPKSSLKTSMGASTLAADVDSTSSIRATGRVKHFTTADGLAPGSFGPPSAIAAACSGSA